MRELESKLFFGRELALPAVVAGLGRLGVTIGQPRKQVDRVFTYESEELLHLREGSVVARIREEEGSASSMAVKRRRAQDLDRDEYEFDISDPSAAAHALIALGLQEVVVVQKTRRSGRLDEHVTVQIDDVEQLGVFVEIEVLGDEWSSAEQSLTDSERLVQAAAGTLGKRIEKGYDHLLMLQKRDQ